MIKIIKMSDNTKDYLEAYYRIFDEMKQKMESVEPVSSIAQNYINTMIPHHEAAIAMSENILKYTTDVEIEALAKDIIQEQTNHIKRFEELKDICTKEDSDRDLFIYQKGYTDAYLKMIRAMGSTPNTNNLNADFLYEMIPHHEGAINMSKNLLKFDICEELRSLTEETIMIQQRQLDEMRALLRKF